MKNFINFLMLISVIIIITSCYCKKTIIKETHEKENFKAVNIDSVKSDYFKIVHIDSLRNGCSKLVNNVFVIYASDGSGHPFKILSHYDRKIHNENTKICQGKFYNLRLYSYFLHGILKLGVGVQCGIQITGCSYYHNSIFIEPENNIKDLYTTTNLNGLYIVEP